MISIDISNGIAFLQKYGIILLAWLILYQSLKRAKVSKTRTFMVWVFIQCKLKD